MAKPSFRLVKSNRCQPSLKPQGNRAAFLDKRVKLADRLQLRLVVNYPYYRPYIGDHMEKCLTLSETVPFILDSF